MAQWERGREGDQHLTIALEGTPSGLKPPPRSHLKLLLPPNRTKP